MVLIMYLQVSEFAYKFYGLSWIFPTQASPWLHLTIAALAQKKCLYIMKLPVSLMLKAVALTIMQALSSPIRDIEVGLVA